jgi:hypothetical protein
VAETDRFSLFTETRERLGGRFARALDEGFLAVAEQLTRPAEGAGEHSAQALGEAAADLFDSHAQRARRGLTTLTDLTSRLLELDRNGPADDEESLLGLLHASELDVQILADELANALRDALEGTYSAWVRRIDSLTRGRGSEVRCPLGAAALAAATIDAVQPLVSVRAIRPVLRAALLEQIVPRLARVVRETDQWLAGRRTLIAVPAPPQSRADAARGEVLAVAASTGTDVGAASPPEAGTESTVVSGLPDALATTLAMAHSLGWSPVASGSTEPAPYLKASALPRPAEFEQDAEAFAHGHGVAAYSREARRLYFAQPRGRMLQLGATPIQLASLDLVATMFDYLCNDPRLPRSVAPLMWRLQQPVATLSALDPGFLGDDRRSLRRLLETLVAISVAHAGELDRQTDAWRRLETVVRAVEVVAHSLHARAIVLGEQVKREFHRAEEGVAAIVARLQRDQEALDAAPGRRNRRDLSRRPSQEAEQAVTRRLEAELRRRLGRNEVPDAVQEFLLAVWLRHLRTAVLRDGEDSPQFRASMQVVDELLWTLDPQAPGLSRQQLARRIPPLIRTLQQGVSSIGARTDEYQPFLDALFLMHLRKMQKMPRDGAPESAEASSSPPTAQTEVRPPVLHEPLTQSSTEPLSERLEITGLASTDDEGAVSTTRLSPDAPLGGVPDVDLDLVPHERSTASASPADARAEARPSAEPSLELDRASRDGSARLPSLLAGIELDDVPRAPRRLQLMAEEAVATLRVGDWLEMTGKDGEVAQLKVAWINPGRTVVLMLRRSDRRVVSVRSSELQQRFARREASLIV